MRRNHADDHNQRYEIRHEAYPALGSIREARGDVGCPVPVLYGYEYRESRGTGGLVLWPGSSAAVPARGAIEVCGLVEGTARCICDEWDHPKTGNDRR